MNQSGNSQNLTKPITKEFFHFIANYSWSWGYSWACQKSILNHHQLNHQKLFQLRSEGKQCFARFFINLYLNPWYFNNFISCLYNLCYEGEHFVNSFMIYGLEVGEIIPFSILKIPFSSFNINYFLCFILGIWK